jgi:hypothetical protein
MQSGTPPASTTPPLISLVFTKLYDWLLGNAYSKQSREHLQILKNIYTKCFNTSSYPANWNLKSNNQPEFSYTGSDFSNYAQPGVNEASVKHFPYYSVSMSDTIITYLNTRKNRRFGSGNPGDLLEQFLGEWLQWSTNSLPNMEYDATTIAKLKNRLTYIDTVIGNIYLFDFSPFVKRKNNKNACLQMIKQNIELAIELAEQETQRRAAKQLLDQARTNISILLTHCINIIFYARKTATKDKVFNINDYVKDDAYPEVMKTHTGKMLYEVILLAGVESFTLQRTVTDTKHTFQYFDAHNVAQKIDWTSNVLNDAPIWIESDKSKEKTATQQRSYTVIIQDLCAAVLRFAEVKKLIEEAYDLTGLAGDLWAYVDKTGKRSIEALLVLYKSELAKLEKAFKDFYDSQTKMRTAYMTKISRKEKNDSNLNFNKIIDKWPQVPELFSQLAITLGEISDKLQNFPANAETAINIKQQQFYQHINEVFQHSYPAEAEKYHLECQTSALTIFANDSGSPRLNTSLQEDNTLSANRFILQRFKLPFNGAVLRDVKKYADFHNGDVKTDNINAIPEAWRLGQSYSDWSENFFNRNRLLFQHYDQLEEKYHEAIKLCDATQIETCRRAIKQALLDIYNKIDSERPKWRFKYLIWPVTIGKPFNREASKFATLLMTDLGTTYKKVKEHATTAIQAITQYNASQNSTTRATRLLDMAEEHSQLSSVTVAPGTVALTQVSRTRTPTNGHAQNGMFPPAPPATTPTPASTTGQQRESQLVV